MTARCREEMMASEAQRRHMLLSTCGEHRICGVVFPGLHATSLLAQRHWDALYGLQAEGGLYVDQDGYFRRTEAGERALVRDTTP